MLSRRKGHCCLVFWCSSQERGEGCRRPEVMQQEGSVVEMPERHETGRYGESPVVWLFGRQEGDAVEELRKEAVAVLMLQKDVA